MEKQCRICKETKPLDEAHWHKRSGAADGFRSECRECIRLKQGRYNRSKERKAERKVYDQEKRRTDPEWVAEQAAYVKEWRKQNPDWRKQYEAQPHVKARKKEEWRNWYEQHGKKWAHERWKNNSDYREYMKQYNAEQRVDPVTNGRIRAHFKAWALENREKIAQYAENRRALELKAEGVFTAADLICIPTKQEGNCFYCDADIGRSYTVDHFVPLSRGGSNLHENIRLCCKPCNSSKKDKLPSGFKPKIKRY